MALDDSMKARISSECPYEIQQILHHAWAHDLSGLKPLICQPGAASSQDPVTGETPLHAAIRSCGPAPTSDSADEENIAVEEAKETVHELFLAGAIWNDVDGNNETPGCVAHRLGRKELYKLCVDAGVRAELLFGLLGGYEELSSGSDEEDEAMEEPETSNGDENGHQQPVATTENKDGSKDENDQVKSEAYLRADLTYSEGKLVDDTGNGVMMAWETDIMRKSVDALLPDLRPGAKVLNIGFGMGIIDTMFADTKPAVHHIIEAHPAVLKHIAEPESKFGLTWEESGPEKGAYHVYAGKWQDVLPELLEEGRQYDAIYFDTFAEDYSQLKLFLSEYVPQLMEEGGRFGFFNGLGADRQVCYDVYVKVVEVHLEEAGLEVDWQDVAVDLKGLEEVGKGEWDGVRRRYWTLDTYRLPVCTFTESG